MGNPARGRLLIRRHTNKQQLTISTDTGPDGSGTASYAPSFSHASNDVEASSCIVESAGGECPSGSGVGCCCIGGHGSGESIFDGAGEDAGGVGGLTVDEEGTLEVAEDPELCLWPLGRGGSLAGVR